LLFLPMSLHLPSSYFFSNAPAPSEIYTLSLHDALPISWERTTPFGVPQGAPPNSSPLLPFVEPGPVAPAPGVVLAGKDHARRWRSEEHTSELQSRFDLVCRLLLEKKKKKIKNKKIYRCK